MTVEFRIKRRAVAGGAGAPASLKAAEIAYNEFSNIIYYGFGDNGSGVATSVIGIGGEGLFAKLNAPTFTGVPAAPTATPGTNTTQLATTAFVAAAIAGVAAPAWTSITGKPSLFPTDIANVSGLQSALDLKAPLAGPAFTGVPTAPTPSGGDNSTKLATTAFVIAQITALINSSPATLDTLAEIATALGNDPNFAATLTASIATKASKASNLSDLTNIATARTNLGLGTMATQNANAVGITGGTIDGVILDGGTF